MSQGGLSYAERVALARRGSTVKSPSLSSWTAREARDSISATGQKSEFSASDASAIPERVRQGSKTDLDEISAMVDRRALAKVNIGGLEAAGEFHFDEQGRLVNFRADRHRDIAGEFTMTPWSTPLTEHNRFDQVELPSAGSATWALGDDEFEDIQIQILDVRYATHRTCRHILATSGIHLLPDLSQLVFGKL